MPNSHKLVKVQQNDLGLRAGQKAEHAAYAMHDFGAGQPIEILRWITSPDSDPERSQAWNDHLYNTVWKINDLATGFTLLIISKAPAGAQNERYNAPDGKGDKKTFLKCNQVQPDSKILAQKDFQDGEIEQAVDWVLGELNK